jgi:tRNA-Thr(GGU) m(6)t(6)A37 methyltransferase TsaA
MKEISLNKNKDSFQMHPIGYVKVSDAGTFLEILEPYRPGLKQLGLFGHILVFWWADKHDTEKSRGVLQNHPPYSPVALGIFATRAAFRPNPIALSVCKVFNVDEENGIVQIGGIDGHDGTPLVDIKPYFPVNDRVKEPHNPEWLASWPEWLPE